MKTRTVVVTLAGAFLMASFGRYCLINEYGEDYLYFSDFGNIFFTCAAVLFVAMVATYICHIMGHIITGTLTGYSLIAVEAYSFILRKTDGKFRLVKKKGKKGIYVRMSPPEYKNGKFPFAFYRLGAVIAFSTVAFVLAGFLLFCFYLEKYLMSFYLFCAFIWFVMNIVTYILPAEKGSPSVIAQIRHIKKDEYVRRAVWTLKKAYTDIHQGIRLKAQPEDRFYMPGKEYFSDDIVSELIWLNLYRYLDRLDFENADKAADILLSEECNQSEIVKKLVLLEKIYIELVTSRRNELIRNMLTPSLEAFMSSRSDNINVKRVKYALALLYYKDCDLVSSTDAALEKAINETENKADAQFTAALKQKAQEAAVGL